MENRKKNVFVVGLDAAHLRDVRNVPDAERFRILPLLASDELIYQEDYPVRDMLDRARQILKEFPEPVDGILGHWDFPVSVMVPILCAENGAAGPSLESVLKCEHKYWSRLYQRAAAPECTPDFCAVDPFAERPFEQVRIDFPFWIKPVKAYASALGFRIENRAQFDEAIETSRKELRRFGDPFNRFLREVRSHAELEEVDGNHLIAEQLVGHREIALEGFVQHGEFHAHGLIDMVRVNDDRSFQRYEYPAQIDRAIARRAADAAQRLLAQIGLDDACFNVEFFWDEEADRLWTIEINTRIAQSHSGMFARVDGMSNHQVALHVAVGERPKFAHGSGPYEHAAHFMYRRFDTSDAVVTHLPSDEAHRRLEERQPDTHFHTELEPGMRLSDLKDQDEYSYVLGELEIGAHSPGELEDKYAEATALLNFGLQPCDT